jgi:CheY-like chemotaxis protein
MGDKLIKVLIADGSTAFIMYISIVLQRMGIDKIIPAESGVEALKLLKILTPDVVMLDILMPLMDGITALKYIKADEQTSGIPVILISTKHDKESREECERLGCSGYLTKPVNITELHKTLQNCITFTGGKKRKFLRTSFNRKVVLNYNGILKEFFAVTLSEGGIFIRKKDPLPVGSEVEVILPLKDKELSLNGTVIYQKGLFGDIFRIPPGMAIEFKDMTAEESTTLRNHIIELLTKDILEEQDEPIITIDNNF